MQVQVARWGNSLGLRIPKDIALRAGLREGARVDVETEGDRIIIAPAQPRYVLAELLKGITPEAMREAFDWGAGGLVSLPWMARPRYRNGFVWFVGQVGGEHAARIGAGDGRVEDCPERRPGPRVVPAHAVSPPPPATRQIVNVAVAGEKIDDSCLIHNYFLGDLSPSTGEPAMAREVKFKDKMHSYIHSCTGSCIITRN